MLTRFFIFLSFAFCASLLSMYGCETNLPIDEPLQISAYRTYSYGLKEIDEIHIYPDMVASVSYKDNHCLGKVKPEQYSYLRMSIQRIGVDSKFDIGELIGIGSSEQSTFKLEAKFYGLKEKLYTWNGDRSDRYREVMDQLEEIQAHLAKTGKCQPGEALTYEYHKKDDDGLIGTQKPAKTDSNNHKSVVQ